ncbi:MAG: hypothetical protein V1913_06075 [Fibrobacterota bacterium]
MSFRILSAIVIALVFSALSAQSDSVKALTMLPTEKHAAVLDALEKTGATFDRASVLAVGFYVDSSAVVLVTLKGGAAPAQSVFPVQQDFFSGLGPTPAAAEPSLPPLAEQPIPVHSTHAATASKGQDGRVYFMLNTMARSLYVYPIQLSTALPNLNETTVGGLTLCTIGGSLYAAYKYTDGMELGYGRVGLMNYGGELGMTYPFLFSQMLQDPDRSFFNEDQNNGIDQLRAWSTMFGFPMGIYLGSRWDIAENNDYGRMNILRFFGRSGILYGYLLPLYFKSDKNGFDNYWRIAPALSMALIPAGIYGAGRILEGKEISSGRGFFVEVTGTLGGLTGITLPFIFLGDQSGISGETYKNLLLTSILGCHAAGTWLGLRYHEERPYKFGQSVFMLLSATAGTTLALGALLTFESNANWDARTYLAGSVIGAWGGLLLGEGLSERILDSSERDPAGSMPRIEFPAAGQWPLLLAASRMKRTGREGGLAFRTDLVTVRF